MIPQQQEQEIRQEYLNPNELKILEDIKAEQNRYFGLYTDIGDY